MVESIGVSPDGQTLYAGGYRPAALTTISTSTNQVGQTIPVSKHGSIDLAVGP